AFPAWYRTDNRTAIIANLITACVDQGIKGLILESYGEGNFPSGNPDTPQEGATYRALADANDRGVIIVDCTQVLAGVVNDSAYAAGAWLPTVGALCPADMTPMAAFAKLMILMAAAKHHNWTHATVKTLFQTNLLGEMISVNRLDSRTNTTLLANMTITALDGSATLTNDPVRGPVLTENRDSKKKVLWSAFSVPPSAAEMPGRLIMQNDGNLVYYNRQSKPIWASNTWKGEVSSSFLTLSGSVDDGNLKLQVYDYLHGQVTRTLYS
ncbi:hypothetical protein, partial [Azospirillum sp. B506]|uniref:hypothetical protein n=1 Tax=Azospirillum sp. B506 TaxID=137721 RepID=UPI0035D4722D